MRVLNDHDVEAVEPHVFVDAARTAVLALASGDLAAPPRTSSDLSAIGDLAYVYTGGGLRHGPSGFRAYRAGAVPGDQLVAVWDATGTLVGLVVGEQLGARRTGALAAVAADALALPEAGDVAVIGSGLQAWAQLWALSSVRRLRGVRVFSPSGEHRNLFAQRARRELGLGDRAVRAVDTPSAAVQGADVVLLATRSTTPVLDADDIAPGAHVSTVGPKARGAQEIPPRLLDRASLISCDSPQQAAAYDRPFVVEPAALTSLAHVLTGRAPGRTRADEITVHCSVGLAGSEVVLAHRLLERSTRCTEPSRDL